MSEFQCRMPAAAGMRSDAGFPHGTVGRSALALRGATTVTLAAAASLLAWVPAESRAAASRAATYANPIDLPYRYQIPVKVPRIQLRLGEAYREAADPTIVFFDDLYWLFASHSGGYWHSADLSHWTFVQGSGYAVDKFAPTVVVIDGRMYLATSEKTRKIWTTDDPKSGVWREAAVITAGYEDPALFRNDDGRLYAYSGLASKGPLRVDELDPKTFQVMTGIDIPQSRDKAQRGWEVPGNVNERVADPSFVEGSWMTRRNDRYYLEYSSPGTEFKTYANGLLTSDHPMGPFTYADYSPFAVKPTGYITGAGHGNTFRARNGAWWHVGTMTISQRHIFERRLGLFPTRFARGGEMIVDTYLGDYPHYLGGGRKLTGWMLLSRRKAATASSELAGFAAADAVDEETRTWWSARTGQPGEWFQIDLGAPKRIDAVQINFADQDSAGRGNSKDGYRYTLSLSDDGRNWRTAVDQSQAGRDAPHDYHVLPRAENARYVRLTNVHSPDGGKFSLYDLRVFGSGGGSKPDRVRSMRADRVPTDGRRVRIGWQPTKGAEFYIVRLGRRADLMNQNFQVYDGATSLEAASLNIGVGYCLAVDAVNENGITAGAAPLCFR